MKLHGCQQKPKLNLVNLPKKLNCDNILHTLQLTKDLNGKQIIINSNQFPDPNSMKLNIDLPIIQQP